MPNNPRQQIKKDLDRCIGHIAWIKDILMLTGEKYREHHPEIVEQYQTVFAFFDQGEELVRGLRDTY